MSASEVQSPASSLNNRLIHQKGILLIQLGAGLGSSVHHERELACRKLERSHVAWKQTNCRMVRQVGCLSREGFRVAAKHCCFRAESKLIIGPNKTLQQPAPKETGPTRHEDILASDFFPKMGSVIEDMI
jgi:hypothetical protein